MAAFPAAATYGARQSAQGKARAAFWRKQGFPNARLARKARAAGWKRYHLIRATHPYLTHYQALELSRTDHLPQYNALMGLTTLPGLGDTLPAGPLAASESATPPLRSPSPVQAPPGPRWWESISGFEEYDRRLEEYLDDMNRRHNLTVDGLWKIEQAYKQRAKHALRDVERVKRLRLDLRAGQQETALKIRGVQVELEKLKLAKERGALFVGAQDWRELPAKLKKRIKGVLAK